MQDLSSMAFQSMKNPQFPEQEQLKCPRCDSTNTKFCYYNNYNLSQPRHFCKNCRRYWTKGGALRNIPVGGGTRKNNKQSPSTKRANPDPNLESPRNVRQELDKSSESGQDPTKNQDDDDKVVDVGGGSSFSSLLMSNGEFRSLFDGLNQTGSGLKAVQLGGSSDSKNSGDIDGGSSEYLQSGDMSGANSGWPDLAIFTNPGSGFQ